VPFGGAPSNNGTNFGGQFDAAQGTLANYGIFARAQYGSGTNYGIYATAVGAPTNYAGYFAGNVNRTGTDNFTSDRNLKQNIDTINNASNTIRQLNPKTFYFDTATYNYMGLTSKKQYGFIAQDVETILPELVSTAVHPAQYDNTGHLTHPALTYKTLNYNAFLGLITSAMQKQQKTIADLTKKTNKQDSINNSLQNQITQMNNAITACCSHGHGAANSGNEGSNGNGRTVNNNINVELSDADALVLNQNVPNPFAEQTVISYHIPKNAGLAQILFYNINGQQIKAVDVTKGSGQLTVYANDLTNGIYSYTLIIDGKIMATKKMVKQD
ncbi:MAG TPA: tail fiber domain-containing protein, partial [Nitrosopumilaceae archaeon]|nr:tail fiber domain-containing protein [Nitrosopumilaceae archaeon]